MARRQDKTYGFEEYVFQARIDEDGEFYLGIPRLPGCVAAGETIDEAVENLRDAFEDWTTHVRADGNEVPAPIDEADYSGKVVLRMPKWLHAGAVERAAEAGVSLNTLLVSYVANGLGESLSSGAAEAVHALERQVSALRTGVADIQSGLAAIGGAVGAAAGGVHGRTWRVSSGPNALTMEVAYSPALHCLDEAAPGYLLPCFLAEGEPQ